MKSIVVGYDGTETAALAAAEGAAVANALAAEFHVVNVINDEDLRQGMSTTAEHEAKHSAAAQHNQRLIDADLSAALDGVTTVNKTLTGSPAWAIVEYATQVEADLIVLGNQHVQGLSRVLGSVAIDVLRHAPCSVYVANTR